MIEVKIICSQYYSKKVEISSHTNGLPLEDEGKTVTFATQFHHQRLDVIRINYISQE